MVFNHNLSVKTAYLVIIIFNYTHFCNLSVFDLKSQLLILYIIYLTKMSIEKDVHTLLIKIITMYLCIYRTRLTEKYYFR